MRKIKKMPKFNSIKEEAEFWDSHSIADYLDEMRSVEVVYKSPREKKETMTIRIAPSLKKKLEDIARGYDIPTSSLIRTWVVEKIKSMKAK